MKPCDNEVILTASEVDAMVVRQETGRLAVALPKGDSILPQKVGFSLASPFFLKSTGRLHFLT